MNDLYQFCLQEIKVTLDNFKSHLNKHIQCNITIEEKMSTDAAFAALIKINTSLDDEKMQKAWYKIQQEIEKKIKWRLSILEFMNIDKNDDKYSYLVLMFK